MPWLTQSAILQQLIGVLNLPILHQADAELRRISNFRHRIDISDYRQKLVNQDLEL